MALCKIVWCSPSGPRSTKLICSPFICHWPKRSAINSVLISRPAHRGDICPDLPSLDKWPLLLFLMLLGRARAALGRRHIQPLHREIAGHSARVFLHLVNPRWHFLPHLPHPVASVALGFLCRTDHNRSRSEKLRGSGLHHAHDTSPKSTSTHSPTRSPLHAQWPQPLLWLSSKRCPQEISRADSRCHLRSQDNP